MLECRLYIDDARNVVASCMLPSGREAKYSIALDPIIARIKAMIRDYHNQLHEEMTQDQVAGVGAWYRDAVAVGCRMAGIKARKELKRHLGRDINRAIVGGFFDDLGHFVGDAGKFIKENKDTISLAAGLIGGPGAGAMAAKALGATDTLDKAKSGDEAAKAKIKATSDAAKQGDPEAQEMMTLLKKLNKLLEAKMAKAKVSGMYMGAIVTEHRNTGGHKAGRTVDSSYQVSRPQYMTNRAEAMQTALQRNPQAQLSQRFDPWGVTDPNFQAPQTGDGGGGGDDGSGDDGSGDNVSGYRFEPPDDDDWGPDMGLWDQASPDQYGQWEVIGTPRDVNPSYQADYDDSGDSGDGGDYEDPRIAMMQEQLYQQQQMMQDQMAAQQQAMQDQQDYQVGYNAGQQDGYKTGTETSIRQVQNVSPPSIQGGTPYNDGYLDGWNDGFQQAPKVQGNVIRRGGPKARVAPRGVPVRGTRSSGWLFNRPYRGSVGGLGLGNGLRGLYQLGLSN